MDRKTLTRAVAAVTLAVLAIGARAAYPEMTVQYIIPFPAGGESDIAARRQQQVFKAKLNDLGLGKSRAVP